MNIATHPPTEAFSRQKGWPSTISDLETEATRARIHRFHAALQAHAERTNRPQAVDAVGSNGSDSQLVEIHLPPAHSEAAEVTAKRRATFARNAILAFTVASVGIGSAGLVHITKEAAFSLWNTQSPKTQAASTEPKVNLRDTNDVLNHDLSSLSMGEVRKHLSYVKTEHGGKQRSTLNASSRVLLSKWASDKVELTEVGLGWKDLYAVIHAETGWLPRTGMGKNGVQSHGLAQFEMATAKAYGLNNAHDPVQALMASARLIRDAAVWTEKRLGLEALDAARRAQVLREGVSVFYNTGWVTRHKWTPERGALLPVATKVHIKNMHAGKMIAATVAANLRAGSNMTLPGLTMEIAASKQAEKLVTHLRLNPEKSPAASSAVVQQDAKRLARAQLAKAQLQPLKPSIATGSNKHMKAGQAT